MGRRFRGAGTGTEAAEELRGAGTSVSRNRALALGCGTNEGTQWVERVVGDKAVPDQAPQSIHGIARETTAGRFMQSVKRTATGEEGEGGVRIEPVEGNPREQARANRKAGPPPGRKTYQARPRQEHRANRPR